MKRNWGHRGSGGGGGGSNKNPRMQSGSYSSGGSNYRSGGGSYGSGGGGRHSGGRNQYDSYNRQSFGGGMGGSGGQRGIQPIYNSNVPAVGGNRQVAGLFGMGGGGGGGGGRYGGGGARTGMESLMSQTQQQMMLQAGLGAAAMGNMAAGAMNQAAAAAGRVAGQGLQSAGDRGAAGSAVDFNAHTMMSRVKFHHLGGVSNLLEDVCKMVAQMRSPDVFKAIGVVPPRGLLLHGPPGSGKTLLAYSIAGEMQVPLIKVAAPEIIAGVTGQSEELLRNLFEHACSNAPSILLIDDIDAICSGNKQDGSSKEMEKRIVSQLVACLDDVNQRKYVNVMVLATSSHPDAIDADLRRAGRFDREFSLGIPNEEQRQDILEVLCNDMMVGDGFSYEKIAHETPGFVGADLMALVREAAANAVNRAMVNMDVAAREDARKQKIEEAEARKKEIERKKKEEEEEKKKAAEKKEEEEQDDKDKEGEVKAGEDEDVSKEESVKEEPAAEEPAHQSVENGDVSKTKTGDMSGIEDEVMSERSHQDNVEADVDDDSVIEARDFMSVFKWLKEHRTIKEVRNKILRDEYLKNILIEPSDFDHAIKKVKPSSIKEGFATTPNVTWEDVGAMNSIKKELRLSILAAVKHRKQFEMLGLTHPSGILLFGPPGCGKTLLAKAIANESGINFISVKGPELLNMYVGESERAVRRVFERARNSSPCIVFFDEIDALAPRRSDVSESGVSARVVNQLLTELDGMSERKQVFIIGATNRPDILDPALLRPGRFDKKLCVNLPSPQDRIDILNKITKNGNKPKLDEDVNMEAIALDSRCSSFTGADLAALVREAATSALRTSLSSNVAEAQEEESDDIEVKVTTEDFEQAFDQVVPSVKDASIYINYRGLVTSAS